MAWSRSKTRLVHKKDGYVSLLSKRFCANSPLLIRGFALLPPACPLLILRITSAPRLFVVTWNNYPVRLVQHCCERSASKVGKRSCGMPATISAAIALL
jgi:hypothetical protein